jgi:amidohydrolase
VVNDVGLAAVAREALTGIPGLDSPIHVPPLTASDDFAEFSARVPGLYIGIGCGGPERAPHHHPRFEPDEGAVLLTSRVQCRALLALLAQRPV